MLEGLIQMKTYNLEVTPHLRNDWRNQDYVGEKYVTQFLVPGSEWGETSGPS